MPLWLFCHDYYKAGTRNKFPCYKIGHAYGTWSPIISVTKTTFDLFRLLISVTSPSKALLAFLSNWIQQKEAINLVRGLTFGADRYFTVNKLLLSILNCLTSYLLAGLGKIFLSFNIALVMIKHSFLNGPNVPRSLF